MCISVSSYHHSFKVHASYTILQPYDYYFLNQSQLVYKYFIFEDLLAVSKE
jgi:hypothetical protein